MNFCTANLFFILSTLPEKAFSQHKTTQNVCSQIYENILKLRKKKLLFKDLFHINFFFILFIQAGEAYTSTVQIKMWILKIIELF